MLKEQTPSSVLWNYMRDLLHDSEKRTEWGLLVCKVKRILHLLQQNSTAALLMQTQQLQIQQTRI